MSTWCLLFIGYGERNWLSLECGEGIVVLRYSRDGEAHVLIRVVPASRAPSRAGIAEIHERMARHCLLLSAGLEPSRTY